MAATEEKSTNGVAEERTEDAAGSGGFTMAMKGGKKALKKSAIAEDEKAEAKPEAESITGMADGSVSGLKAKEGDAALVIPLPEIRGSSLKAAVAARSGGAAEGVSSEDKEAEQLLLEEARAAADGGDDSAKENVSDLELPMLMRNRPDGWMDLTDDDEKYKKDVQSRPDAPTIENYEKISVEAIGMAMLRGMGWAPGKGVGKTNVKVVEPIQFLKRPDGLGLGATPAAIPERKKDKKIIKPGERRDEKQEFHTSATGKSVATLDEKLKKRKTAALEEGAIVDFVSGDHKGLKGEILKVSGQEASVRLKINDMVVRVAKSEIKVDLEEDEPQSKKRVREEDGHSHHREKREKKEKKKEKKEKKERRERLWMLQDIKVRVVDRDLKRGKHYLHKGRIMDVISIDDLTAEVMLDPVDGRAPVRVDVHQRQIETALCKVGGYVLIVKGKNRGKRGKLLDRNKEQQTVAVQLDADRSIYKCTMDDVAEHAPDRDDVDVEDSRRDFDLF